MDFVKFIRYCKFLKSKIFFIDFKNGNEGKQNQVIDTYPSLSWHVLVVVHSDALVRGGDRCGPGTANHNIVGGTVGVGSVGVVVVGGGAVVVVVIVAVIAWWAAAIAVNSATATADTAVAAAAATDGATVR